MPDTRAGTTRQAGSKKATIVDVAKAAGVAVGTVSRYLNGLDVRRGNRADIEKAVEVLGFRRNAVAQAMRGNATNLVGFLLPSVDEFHARLLNHVARRLQQTGRTMLTYYHEDSPSVLAAAVDFFSSQRVDALILTGGIVMSGRIRALQEQGIPIVVYNNDVPGLRVDRVFVENARASCRAVCHLADMGHRKIAVVYGRPEETTGAQRLEGYKRALAERSMPFRADYAHPGRWSAEGGYQAMQKFMALADPPTAVFSANYVMTMGILEWLKEHACRIPAAMAVVSFDDVPLFRLYEGGITAIAQPVEKLAEAIAGYVLSRLRDGDVPDRRSRILDCDIILRGSSGPASDLHGT